MQDFVIPDKEQQQLNEKLEEFAKLLRKRTTEFHEKGHFSDRHGSFMREIEKKNDALRAKISEAAQARNSWSFVKAELLRDYEAAFNEFMTLGDGVDAEELKRTR